MLLLEPAGKGSLRTVVVMDDKISNQRHVDCVHQSPRESINDANKKKSPPSRGEYRSRTFGRTDDLPARLRDALCTCCYLMTEYPSGFSSSRSPPSLKLVPPLKLRRHADGGRRWRISVPNFRENRRPSRKTAGRSI